MGEDARKVIMWRGKWYLLGVGLWLCVTDLIENWDLYYFPAEPTNRFILGALCLMASLIISRTSGDSPKKDSI